MPDVLDGGYSTRHLLKIPLILIEKRFRLRLTFTQSLNDMKWLVCRFRLRLCSQNASPWFGLLLHCGHASHISCIGLPLAWSFHFSLSLLQEAFCRLVRELSLFPSYSMSFPRYVQAILEIWHLAGLRAHKLPSGEFRLMQHLQLAQPFKPHQCFVTLLVIATRLQFQA